GPCVSPSVYHKSRQGKQKKPRYDKINPDPYAYAKRTARRVATAPARRSHPVGPSRTPQEHACRLLEDPHLAISCAHGTNARRLHRPPATDSRRPAAPTSRMGRGSTWCSRSAAVEKDKYPTGFRKTLGSGLNAGNIGAEIDVIKPACLPKTHAPIAIHFAFGVSRTSFLDRLAHFLRLCATKISAEAFLSAGISFAFATC